MPRTPNANTPRPMELPEDEGIAKSLEPRLSTLTITDLRPDENNYRIHNAENLALIENGINEFGLGRSIVIDENNTIIAGNGLVEAAGNAGIGKVRVIDVGGDEIVAVRRSNLTETQKTRMGIADNRASDLSEFDAAALIELNESMPEMLDGFFNDNDIAELAEIALEDAQNLHTEQAIYNANAERRTPDNITGEREGGSGVGGESSGPSALERYQNAVNNLHDEDSEDEDEEQASSGAGRGGGGGGGVPRGTGGPVIRYDLIFDNDPQQSRFHLFLRWLKGRYADERSIASRLDKFLTENVPEAVGLVPPGAGTQPE